MHDRWDAGLEGCRKGGMQEMRDARQEGERKEGCRKYCTYIFKRGEMQIVSAMAKIRKDDNFYLRI